MNLILVPADMYFQPAITPLEALRAMRKALEELGTILGGPLTPVLPKYGTILEQEDAKKFDENAYRLTFQHDALITAIGADAPFVTFSLIDDEGSSACRIRISVNKSSDGNELSKLWQFMTDVL